MEKKRKSHREVHCIRFPKSLRCERRSFSNVGRGDETKVEKEIKDRGNREESYRLIIPGLGPGQGGGFSEEGIRQKKLYKSRARQNSDCKHYSMENESAFTTGHGNDVA